jgi:hypothetical protein
VSLGFLFSTPLLLRHKADSVRLSHSICAQCKDRGRSASEIQRLSNSFLSYRFTSLWFSRFSFSEFLDIRSSRCVSSLPVSFLTLVCRRNLNFSTFSTAVIKRILSTDAYKDVKNHKPVTILDKISNAKSKMMTPDSYRVDQENNKSRDEREDISRVWRFVFLSPPSQRSEIKSD